MSLLYNLFIQPLIVVFDLIFSIINSMIETPVVSIIVFSVVINILVSPLYNKAEMKLKEEQENKKKRKKWEDHIRKNFKGNERFMMLSAYYRIEGYKPYYAIKESFPLLIQVPFFIAAYKYISSLTIFEGISLGGINNLMKADSMLKIGGFGINVLPILMTIVNLLSSYLYSKDGPVKQKVQLYITALVFLVLLYNSPSILVIYWLMNNVFSAFRIIYNNNKTNNIVPHVIISIVLVMIVVIGVVAKTIDSQFDKMMSVIIVLFSICNIVKNVAGVKGKSFDVTKKRFCRSVFKTESFEVLREKDIFKRIIMIGVCYALLMGLFIPTSVISSSVNEFVNSSSGSFYYDLITYPLSIYIGIFVIWMPILLYSKDKVHRVGSAGLLWVILGIAVINQFVISPNYGTLYSDLTLENEMVISVKESIVNLVFSLVGAFIFWIIYTRKSKFMEYLAVSIIFTLSALSVWNIHIIYKELKVPYESLSADNNPIKLSKNGKNVVVIMLDRAIGTYVPYIFEEKKELKDKYKGFVYYPNTVSFGIATNYGTPGLFGGYEYTPSKMNKRDKELLVDKHNEALKVMPVIFMNSGYDVTVCDPPYANYQEIPDLSIYDEYQGINAYNLKGKYSVKFGMSLKADIHERQKRNFLMFSLFKTAPFLVKDAIYDGGNYIGQAVRYTNYNPEFIDAYSVLSSLSDITEVKDDDNNYFLMMQNDTPHNPVLLNPPDYKVDNEKVVEDYVAENREINGVTMKLDTKIRWIHYCVNVASYSELSNWLEYLRDRGVYDNTRIILVADHGYYLDQFDNMITQDGLDVECFNPLLMVKDFNSDDKWSTYNEFMTNADVPTLAVKDVIDNPINPFTGKKITNEEKYKGPLLVTDSSNLDIEKNNGYKYDLLYGHWWSVHDDIFDLSNWKLEE